MSKKHSAIGGGDLSASGIFFSFGEANIEDFKNLGRGLLSQSINSPPLSLKSEEDELGDVILDDLRGVSWIELMEESIIVVFLLKKILKT